jgi:hypothetical protein
MISREQRRRKGEAVNRRRTLRWMRVDDPLCLEQALFSHVLMQQCEVATVFDRVYARAICSDTLLEEALFRGGWFLSDAAEVYVLQAEDEGAARKLAEALSGPGGLASVTDVMVQMNEVLVEFTGNSHLLFAYIDHLAKNSRIKRRSLFELHDTTLISVASYAWSANDLETFRILEVAAGEDPW